MEKRSFYWDNVKAILIFLVVLGHYLLVIQNKSVLVEAVYWWIYIFHMPAFVFVSGYFAKSFVKRRGDKSKLLGFLILYVVYVVLLWITNTITTKEIRVPSMFSTGSAQWYMLAMFFWYLMLLFVAEFPGKVVIPIVFIVALWVGIDKNAGSFLAASRILVFFPFFLIGYYVKGEWVEKISKKVKIVGALFLTAVFVALLYYREFLSMLLKCVYGDKSYTAMGMTNVEGILYRSLWYLAATGMTVAFLCVVSSHKRFFTYIGAYTLPIYVIHRVLRDVFVMLGLYSAIGNGTLALIVCCVISIALVFFCASKGLAKVFNYAFQIGTIHKK